MKMKCKLLFTSLVFAAIVLFISCSNGSGNDASSINYTITNGWTKLETSALGSASDFGVTVSQGVYKIVLEYESKGPEGSRMSGVIYIPEDKVTKTGNNYVLSEDIPGIILANHATIRNEESAPSKINCSTEALLASCNGFIVCMPDYAGFGADAGHYHPYCHKSYLARESIDMLKVAKKLAYDYGWKDNNAKYFNIGHSEGGFVTLAVAEYAKENGVTFAGSYASAPPNMTNTFIDKMIAYQTYSDVTGYLLYDMYGLKAVYGDKAGYNCEDLISEAYKTSYGSYFNEWLRTKTKSTADKWDGNGQPIFNTGSIKLLIDDMNASGMKAWIARAVENGFNSTDSVSKIKAGSNNNIHIWCAEEGQDMVCEKSNLPADFQTCTTVVVANQRTAHGDVWKAFLKALLTEPQYGIKKQ